MRSVSPGMGIVLLALVGLNGLAALAMVRGLDTFGAGGSTAAREARSGESAWHPPATGGAAGYRTKPLAAFAQTLARPIFARSRRPYVAPVAAVAAAPAAEPSLPVVPVAEPAVTLAAVSILGENRRALLVSKGHPAGRWMNLGDTFDDWKIATISPDRLTLSTSGRTMTVMLYPEPGTASAAARPPQP